MLSLAAAYGSDEEDIENENNTVDSKEVKTIESKETETTDFEVSKAVESKETKSDSSETKSADSAEIKTTDTVEIKTTDPEEIKTGNSEEVKTTEANPECQNNVESSEEQQTSKPTAHHNDTPLPQTDTEVQDPIEIVNEIKANEVSSEQEPRQHVELVSAYASDGDTESDDETEEGEIPEEKTEEQFSLPNVSLDSLKEKYKLNLAPVVHQKTFELDTCRTLIDAKTKDVKYNPKYEDLFAAEVGPVNPFKTRQQLAQRNSLAGFIEPANFSSFHFENQHKTFHSYGYALDPSVEGTADKMVGDITRLEDNDGKTVFEKTKKRAGDKRQREAAGDPGDIDGYLGPWGKFVDERTVAKPNTEQQQVLDEYESKKEKNKKVEDDKVEEKTKAHIEDLYDYQGRPFLHIPKDHSPNLYSYEPPEKCFLPKKQIHTWSGHSKGVSAIRLFPRSGHLLLSASMDCKIKIWEVYEQRRNIRTYIGHSKAVKDICFNNDGTRFLSCGYDRWMKLWDTETGECIGRFSNKKIPYCIKFNPDEDKQHLFIAGMSDKKMVTWDIRENEIVQEYDRHLGAVNTITFFDKNKQLITTSDDKSIRIWEWDIPVDSKLIQEPSMHSMPSVTLSPNLRWLACQSMDNQILIYNCFNRFRQNRKKVFKGHMNAGYACQVNFSPDMSYLISGDADGKLNIWDWKTTKLYSKFKAHSEVCIGCVWLPHETSKIITCGWDGLIKLWD